MTARAHVDAVTAHEWARAAAARDAVTAGDAWTVEWSTYDAAGARVDHRQTLAPYDATGLAKDLHRNPGPFAVVVILPDGRRVEGDAIDRLRY